MDKQNRKRDTPESMSDDVDIQEIRTIIEEIVQSPGTVKDKERDFEMKYPQFAEKYPFLFKTACKPDFDKDRLEQIFRMMGQVKSNKMSYDTATKQFGQDMFDTYVKPNLNKMNKK
jgi:hypothetical protein